MKKIVVAESSPTIKSVADTLLRQNGYDVICTSDGLQAWEVISSGKPDLVLTGLNLSGMNGLELCRQMAGDGLSGGIPVVVMIGGRDKVPEEALLASGIKAKLKKPFSPRDLLNIVTKLIGKGEKTNRPAAVSRETTLGADYGSDIPARGHRQEEPKNDIYNLDWTDLNDAGEIVGPNLTEDDAVEEPGDDQEIIISEDQFGLASLNIERDEDEKPYPDPSTDEDYDWFVGEMKKENSKEPEKQPHKDKSEKIEIPPAGPKEKPGIDNEEIKFEDFQTAGPKLIIPQVAPPKKKIPQKQPSKVGTAVSSQKLSDEELSRIADKVVQNLAAAIAATIDRQKILDVIKSVVNQ
jgi:CheY-like chemotaxis protein